MVQIRDLNVVRGERWLSGGFVWGCSEKVPTATGFISENDRVEGAIGGKTNQNAES
jgi:hypothetical protein